MVLPLFLPHSFSPSLSLFLSASFLTARGIAPTCSTPVQGHIPGSVSVSGDSICFTETGSVFHALPRSVLTASEGLGSLHLQLKKPGRTQASLRSHRQRGVAGEGGWVSNQSRWLDPKAFSPHCSGHTSQLSVVSKSGITVCGQDPRLQVRDCVLVLSTPYGQSKTSLLHTPSELPLSTGHPHHPEPCPFPRSPRSFLPCTRCSPMSKLSKQSPG